MNQEVCKSLLELEHLLRDAPRAAFPVDGKWTERLPARGGVYAIWRGMDPVYVGESCHLKHRLGDLTRAGTHGFRRKVAATIGIEPDRVVDELARNYCLSFVTDILGRKELEEFLTVRWLKKIPGRLGCCDNINEIQNA
jgi:hypothetical protein